MKKAHYVGCYDYNYGNYDTLTNSGLNATTIGPFRTGVYLAELEFVTVEKCIL